MEAACVHSQMRQAGSIEIENYNPYQLISRIQQHCVRTVVLEESDNTTEYFEDSLILHFQPIPTHHLQCTYEMIAFDLLHICI